MNKQTGNIFIVSGPSGVGKDSIVNAVLKKHSNFSRLITCTSRQPRDGEKSKRTYKFLSEEDFLEKIKFKQFAEWQIVHNNYYGALKEDVDLAFSQNKNLIFDIDVKGALTYKKIYPQCVLIFIKYESLELLKQRLQKRDRDISDEEITQRLQTAQSEMLFESDFNYSVVNPEGHLEKAVEEVEKIIKKEIKK